MVGRASRGGTSTRARVPRARSNPGEHDVRRRHPAHARRVARGEDLRARRSRNGPRRRRGPARRRDVVDVAPALAGRVARLPRTTQHPRRTRPPPPRASLARVPSPPRVVERVRDAIGPRRVDRSHWVPDADAPACANPACASEFTLINRRHHCRCCGDVFCRKCTATRLLLDPANGAPTRKVSSDAVQARVCLHCYERALDAAAEAEAAAVAEAAADTRCVATSPTCRRVTRERAPTRRRRRMRGEDETEGAAVDDARVLGVSLRARAHRGVRARPGRVRPRRYTPCRSA